MTLIYSYIATKFNILHVKCVMWTNVKHANIYNPRGDVETPK